jgi:aminoglycoside phosphotransferase family enzyme/predicted kinase
LDLYGNCSALDIARFEAMMTEIDQNAVLIFLANPETYHIAAPPRRIDTHGAIVFLADEDVYKVKRAVRYPYMDFSTLAKRKVACEAEVSVNRAQAPNIYLGVIPITRDDSGLHLGGAGEIVEWSVHMRRFDENSTLDLLAHTGVLDAEIIDRLAQNVTDMHAKAPMRDGTPAVVAFRAVVFETLHELEARKDIFQPETVASLRANLEEACRKNEQLQSRRGKKGKVRRCHGDLHLGNIVLEDGIPILFDAIEFDESIATIDILYDLAFLIMDLCERGLSVQACHLLNRYLWLSDDEIGEIEGLVLLPMFLALRAAIRAKILVAQADLTKDTNVLFSEARRYVDAAALFLAPATQCLIAVGGLSGTGKTTLASGLAPEFGAPPGALHLRSDIERKKAFGASEFTRLKQNAYSSAASAEIYQRLGELGEAGIRAGRCVIVDATFQQEADRRGIALRAAQLEVPFAGLWLEGPVEILKTRVCRRRNDASDATANVVTAQAAEATGTVAWQRIDASGTRDSVIKAARVVLSEVPCHNSFG